MLAGLRELLAPMHMSDREFVGLFENPLLPKVVDPFRSSVRALLDAGLDLRGKSLTRLRFDVDARLHDEITAFRESEPTDDEGASSQTHGTLIQKAGELGYRPLAPLQALIDKAKGDEKRISGLLAENEELARTVKTLSRRKARYLRRMRARERH